MKQEALSYFEHTNLTLLALLIFFLWFTIMLVWIFKLTPRQLHDKISQLPLQDEVGNG